MKNIILLITTFVFVSPLYAFEIKNLRDVYNAASGYYESGHDNNYLENKIISKNQFLKFANNKISLSMKADESFDEAQALNTIKDCVFYAKGAYGDHLSKEEQQNLSFKFLNDVVQKLKPEFYRIEGSFLLSESPLYSSSCALGLQVGNNVLILQGVTVD